MKKYPIVSNLQPGHVVDRRPVAKAKPAALPPAPPEPLVEVPEPQAAADDWTADGQ